MVSRDIIQRLLAIINDTRTRLNTLESREVALLTATQTLTNKTLTTPTIGDYTNAQHAHTNAASGGTISHGSLTDLTTGDPHTQYLLESTYDANTILKADSNDTPVALTVGASTIVGRASTGSITALTASQVATIVQGSIDHGSIMGLADDDHTGYARLAGRSGGQTLTGGTAANDDLTLEGTSNATRTTSYVVLQPNGGNVGIGTVSPNNRLEVNVSNNTTTLYEDASYPLKITNTSTTNSSYAGMYFGSGLGVGATIQAVYPNASTRAEANLLLSTRNSGGSLSERMRITSGGNVGIGTVNPGNFSGLAFGDAILDVYGVIQVRSDATNNVAALNFGGDTYRKAAMFAPVGTEDPYLSFAVSTSGTTSSALERMRILSNGNIGIGTTSPGAKLHIVGPNTSSGISLNVGGGGDTVLASGGSLFFDNNYSYDSGNYIRPIAANTQTFVTSGTERMRITSTGNVGIGTTSPSRKLHVVGTILVDGDEGGIAGTIGLTDGSDLSARSTGVGTIKFNDATNRDSSGFVKIYIGTTDYYVPVFAAI